MSKIVGMICGAVVKGLASNSISKGVETIVTKAIAGTSLPDSKAVCAAVKVGSGVVGMVTVDKLIDTANMNGTPITGRIKAETYHIKYDERGIRIGVPDYKKKMKVVDADKKA